MATVIAQKELGPTQRLVLEVLTRPMTLSEVTAAVGRHGSSVHKSLSGLVKAGLVTVTEFVPYRRKCTNRFRRNEAGDEILANSRR